MSEYKLGNVDLFKSLLKLFKKDPMQILFNSNKSILFCHTSQTYMVIVCEVYVVHGGIVVPSENMNTCVRTAHVDCTHLIAVFERLLHIKSRSEAKMKIEDLALSIEMTEGEQIIGSARLKQSINLDGNAELTMETIEDIRIIDGEDYKFFFTVNLQRCVAALAIYDGKSDMSIKLIEKDKQQYLCFIRTELSNETRGYVPMTACSTSCLESIGYHEEFNAEITGCLVAFVKMANDTHIKLRAKTRTFQQTVDKQMTFYIMETECVRTHYRDEYIDLSMYYSPRVKDVT